MNVNYAVSLRLVHYHPANDTLCAGQQQRALGEIGDAGAVPALIKALADSNDGVRRAAAEALCRIVTNNNELDIAIVREAAKKLAIHAYDWSESVRTAAAEALERAVALLTLRKVTEDHSANIDADWSSRL